MSIAAITAARHAVGAAALAALAVSAILGSAAITRTPKDTSYLIDIGEAERGELVCGDACGVRVALGRIAVVGTPDYDRVVERVGSYHDAIASCFTLSLTGRITAYAHVVGGVVDQVSVLGDHSMVGTCVAHVVGTMHFDVDDPMDLMIPIDDEWPLGHFPEVSPAGEGW